MTRFVYYVYNPDGGVVFHSCRLYEARLWLGGGNYIVRKDLMGNTPDKIYKK